MNWRIFLTHRNLSTVGAYNYARDGSAWDTTGIRSHQRPPTWNGTPQTVRHRTGVRRCILSGDRKQCLRRERSQQRDGYRDRGGRGSLFGVEYPGEEPVELESSDATGGGGCVFFACADFEYDGVTVVVLTDNSGGLTVDSIETEVNNDDITGGDGVRDEPSTELREVVGDFRCPSSGSFLGQGGQDSREEVVTVDVQTSGGVEVEIEREVDVECIPD